MEDEINLIDYVKVILKRKVFILTVFLLAIIIAGIFSFLSPKVYKVDTVLEIGTFAEGMIGSPEQLVEKFNVGAYKILTMEKLDISELAYPNIKTSNPEGTNLIIREIESTDTERAKLILKEANNLILADHRQKFDESKIKIENEIEDIEKTLALLETQKIYADQGISDLKIAVLELKNKLNFIKDTEVIKPPAVSQKPIKPRPFINVAIAGILGLFIGLFLAFGKEWWEKSKYNQ